MPCIPSFKDRRRRVSASNFWDSAIGSRLLGFGFRLRAIGFGLGTRRLSSVVDLDFGIGIGIGIGNGILTAGAES